MNFADFNKIIVSFSGGKDSLACVLWLLEQGCPKDKIVLWHQAIDGMKDTHKSFFDWQSTDNYCRAIAKMFGLPLGFQWRAFGMYGEMYRENALTGDVYYIQPGDDAVHCLKTKGGKLTTRRMFPAKNASLKTRWCSSYLKIDPAARVLSNLAELKGTILEPKKILFLTGERREESAGRSRYKKEEPHRCNTKSREVTHFRPVIDFKETEVWSLIEKYRIIPHPAYFLGFPRLSCRSCIFYSPDHWATLKEIDPSVIKLIRDVELDLGHTLDNKLTINEMVSKGKSLFDPKNRAKLKHAINPNFKGAVRLKFWQKWELPCGAFGKEGGAL